MSGNSSPANKFVQNYSSARKAVLQNYNTGITTSNITLKIKLYFKRCHKLTTLWKNYSGQIIYMCQEKTISLVRSQDTTSALPLPALSSRSLKFINKPCNSSEKDKSE